MNKTLHDELHDELAAAQDEIETQAEMIVKLKASLTELLNIYWGPDGTTDPPEHIKRAKALL